MNRLYLQTSRRLATATMMSRRYTAVALSPVITHTLPSAVSYPSPADIQLQQRWMASKKGKGKKGGNNNSNKSNKKKGPTKFEPIFYNSDIELANDDNYSLAETFKDLNDLQKQLYEYGWEKKNLELMDNNGTWKKLTNDELKKFNGKIVKVRDKEIYEEEEEDYDSSDDNDYGSDDNYSGYDDDDDEYSRYNPDDDYGDYKDGEDVTKKRDNSPPMRECIGKLIAELKFNGYERLEANTLQKASTGETILTKEYILKKASDDEELLSLLVDNIGALDHVVQWIHFDMVWNNVEIDDDKDDDDGEKPFKDL